MNLTFMQVATHPLIYGMVTVGILMVLGISAIMIQKSWKRALELGYKKEDLMKIVKSSGTFSIMPAIGIVIGLFALSNLIGTPWAWWRLSVIGSLTYETMAAKIALGTLEISAATAKDFVLVMFVMTIGIMGGLVLAPIMAERIHTGSVKMKDKDSRWGALGNSTFMLAIILAFVVPMFFQGIVVTLTLLTSIITSYILVHIAQKYKVAWLGEFIIVFTMLAGMLSSLIWTSLFK